MSTMVERGVRDGLITSFKFLYQFDDVDSEHFFMRVTRGHNKKLHKKLVRKNVRKYIFTIRVVDARNKSSEEIVNAGSKKKN